MSGIVRRIDDLGRIVIPKEIRKSLRINSGDNLEIYTSGDDIVLRKYNEIDCFKDLALVLVSSVSREMKRDVMVTNTDKVIAYGGKRKGEYVSSDISSELSDIILSRKEKVGTGPISFTTDITEDVSYAIFPIIASGDVVGSFIIFDGDDVLKSGDISMAKVLSSFLGKHIED